MNEKYKDYTRSALINELEVYKRAIKEAAQRIEERDQRIEELEEEKKQLKERQCCGMEFCDLDLQNNIEIGLLQDEVKELQEENAKLKEANAKLQKELKKYSSYKTDD